MLVRQTELYSKVYSLGNFEWFLPLYSQIATRFVQPAGTSDGFPCVFAQNAFKRKNIKFSLVRALSSPSAQTHDLGALATDLRVYLRESEDWDGSINTTEPLLAVFESFRGQRGVLDYENMFDSALQYLIDNDPLPWPEHTHTDAASPFWSMCFSGTQIFVNASHPAHYNRRSRNLCDSLVLVINPRERFDRVAGNTPKGHHIRQQIRSNVTTYDRIPQSPLLDHYLSGGLEWPQYMLPDDNSTSARKCPLNFRSVNVPTDLRRLRAD